MKDRIRQRAEDLGFDECRFTSATSPATGEELQRWLTAGRHGEMAWLGRNIRKRLDPQQILPGMQSMIVVAASHGEVLPSVSESPGQSANRDLGTRPPTSVDSFWGMVARYARHSDYHQVLGERLKSLSTFVNELGGAPTRSLWHVDTGPILEREFAQRAGVGFVGKHTNIVSRRLGNWVLLGEILTTLELDPDVPERNCCGNCTRCLDACPTRAIVAPFQLDARLCISYLTIELKGPIPTDLRPAIGDRIFGCDDCLAVCPWNRFARAGRLMQSHARSDLAAPDLLELLRLDEATFRYRFKETPLSRIKLKGLRRNVCVALGNVGDSRCLPALQTAASGADAQVAEHACWAIDRIERKAP